MSSFNDFNNYQKTTLLKYRAGTSDDPYINLVETKEVIDSKIYTNEIPSIEDKILITSMFEIESDDTDTLTNSQYRVDYNEGIIYFNSSLNGTSITYRYKGRGNHFISAGRVWTREQDGEVLETLEGIIDASKEAIKKTEELIDLSERVEEAVEKVEAVEASGVYARQQGDYAKLEGDKAKQIVDTAGDATEIINQTRTYAEQIANEIETMVDDVETNSNYAKQQGDYAKTQGDYAKTQGDGAKAIATGMVNKGTYNASTAYIPLNIVVYQGSVYQNIQASTGIVPTNVSYWVKLVETATSTTWDSIAGKPDIEGHIADQTNPHHVTAEQVGTYTKSTIDQKIASANPTITLIDSYTSTDKTKPPTADALRAGLATTLSSAQSAAQSDATSKANTAESNAKTFATTSINAHVADYVRQPAFSATTGTGAAYVVTLNPAPTTISEGFGITIVPNITNTGAVTLAVNGLTPITLKKKDGTDFSSGDLVASRPYSFRKVGSYFILDEQGGGINTSDATATAPNILSGLTAYGPTGKITGTMTKIAANTGYFNTQGPNNFLIPQGYYDGTSYIGGNSQLIPKNIREGVFIGTQPGNTSGTLPVQKSYAGTVTQLLSYTSMSYATLGSWNVVDIGRAIIEGTVTFAYSIYIASGSPAGNYYSNIFINGVAAGVQRALSYSSVSYSENIVFVQGDTISFGVLGPNGGTVSIAPFKITAQNRTGNALTVFKSGAD